MSVVMHIGNEAGPSGPRISLGDEHGLHFILRFGENPDMTVVSTPEDIWSGGGLYTGFPTGTAETVEILSDNAADTAAGTGARSVQVTGLDENFLTVTESIALNGTTPVATTSLWTRSSLGLVETAGSGEKYAGTITIRHTTTPANVFNIIPPGRNATQSCVFTVPADKRMVITHHRVSISRANDNKTSGVYSLRARSFGGVFLALAYADITTTSSPVHEYRTGIALPPNTDVKFEIDSVADNNTAAVAMFEAILFDSTAVVPLELPRF